LEKNPIRLRHSGLIIFTAKLLSVATGIIFILLITRSTNAADYGVWNNIFDVTAYFTLFAGALPFWATRFVARGKKGAEKAGLLSNLIVALIATAFYITLASVITTALHVGEEYLALYVIASAQVLEVYLISTLEPILQTKKPQAVGYGLVIEEVCKVVLAYILIVELQKPLLGAITALILAALIQITYYLKLLSADFKVKTRWEYVKEWLKGSTGYIYRAIGAQTVSYIFIFLFVYGGDVARGNYGAAATIANMITISLFLSYALYPKLLAESSPKDVTTSLRMVLTFAIPMTVGVMTMANSLIISLSETYREAGPILFVLAIDALIATLFQFFTIVLFGVERFDEEAEISLKDLVRSRMFKAFSLSYIQSAIALPTAFYLLTHIQNQPLQSALCVSIIILSADFATLLVLYTIVRKMIRMDIPWKSVAKYALASAVMAAILFVIPYPPRLYSILGVIAMGGIIYFALLMIIDKETRLLANSIWQEIKLTVKRTTT
jgi:O-antigen/teichoic acid export membrane protein